ncbi:D-sedoheptulose 7-phosphate isomerase [soil metagenome]
MTDLIKKNIQDSLNVKQALLADNRLIGLIAQVSELISTAFEAGNRVYFCGNGGSAADAQHLAAEFSGPFYNRGRRALPAEALHCNTSYLTAAANDYDYNSVYARLVEGIMNPGDILIGMSTSGNSGNVVKAFEAARTRGVITVGMTGQGGGKMKELSDHLFNVPSSTTPRIQEVHMLAGHIICEIVEAKMFPPAI